MEVEITSCSLSIAQAGNSAVWQEKRLEQFKKDRESIT